MSQTLQPVRIVDARVGGPPARASYSSALFFFFFLPPVDSTSGVDVRWTNSRSLDSSGSYSNPLR